MGTRNGMNAIKKNWKRWVGRLSQFGKEKRKKNKVEQTLDDLYDQIISECNINDAKNSG